MATPIGTLWGIQRQPQTRVVRHNQPVAPSKRLMYTISLQILSVAALNDFELKQPTFSFQDKPADFTEKFSYGKIPAFEGTDGFKLIEGLPISRYREWLKFVLFGRVVPYTHPPQLVASGLR